VPPTETVLVTGATGYIAQHCLLQLLQQGYRVRGTLRNPTREAALREALRQHVEADDRLELVVADLEVDTGWAEAARGCTHLLHTASPVMSSEPKDAGELIRPALEGTQRVLSAAVAAGIRRIVLTSSVAAISSGHPPEKHNFTEADWSNEAGSMGAYARSKTLAERAAWDFVRAHAELELTTINPVYVIGPSLDGHFSPSADIVRLQLQRAYPGVPRLGFPLVDVRDVASAHVAALNTPAAAGKRFICHTGFLWMKEIGQILNDEFASQGYRIPLFPIPDFAMRLMGLVDGTVRLQLPQLGKTIDYSTALTRQVLQWAPRPLRDSIIDTGRQLIASGSL
jgi:dihydroflavonol-4-reductase